MVLVVNSGQSSETLPPLLVDGPAIARELRVDPSTIRAWASAGLITRRGKDNRGRTLYDYDEVVGVSRAGARGVKALRQLRSHPNIKAELSPEPGSSV